MTQLETLVQEIEQGNLDVDILTKKTETAVALIAHCRTLLTQADGKIKEMLATISEDKTQDSRQDLTF